MSWGLARRWSACLCEAQHCQKKRSKCMSGQCTALQPSPMRISLSVNFVCSTPSVKFSNRATRQWRFQTGRRQRASCSIQNTFRIRQVTHTCYCSSGSISRRVVWTRSSSLGTRVRLHLKDKGKEKESNKKPAIVANSVIPVLERWWPEDCKCRVCLDHVASPVQPRKLPEPLSQWDLRRAKGVAQ